jgi:hypothetical protein
MARDGGRNNPLHYRSGALPAPHRAARGAAAAGRAPAQKRPWPGSAAVQPGGVLARPALARRHFPVPARTAAAAGTAPLPGSPPRPGPVRSGGGVASRRVPRRAGAFYAPRGRSCPASRGGRGGAPPRPRPAPGCEAASAGLAGPAGRPPGTPPRLGVAVSRPAGESALAPGSPSGFSLRRNRTASGRQAARQSPRASRRCWRATCRRRRRLPLPACASRSVHFGSLAAGAGMPSRIARANYRGCAEGTTAAKSPPAAINRSRARGGTAETSEVKWTSRTAWGSGPFIAGMQAESKN